VRLGLSATYRDLIAVVVIIGVCTGLLGIVHGISVLQFLITGFVVGSIYVLGATGLTLIFGIRKFANFAHGDMMSFGAYMAFLVNALWMLDILWGVVFAIAMTAILGIVMELLVFRKLATRGPVSALVASIGITIFLQNFLNFWFGTSINQYNIPLPQNVTLLAIDGVTVLYINPLRGVATLVVGTVLIVFLHVLLRFTTIGKAMRATADNPDLARATGIKVRRVVLFTWATSGAFAGIAGVLLGIFVDVRPGIGFSVLLFVFAAVIVGGLGSPYGAMLGGFIVGIALEMSAAFLILFARADVSQGVVDAFRSPAGMAIALGATTLLMGFELVDARARRDQAVIAGVLGFVAAWCVAAVAHVIPPAWGAAGLLAPIAAGAALLPVRAFEARRFIFASFLAGVLWIPAILALLLPGRVGAVQQPVAFRPIFAFIIMILVLLIRPGGLAIGKASVIRAGHGGLRRSGPAQGADRA
jgi:branched-subunit amino acid ABC-type transport system permease component